VGYEARDMKGRAINLLGLPSGAWAQMRKDYHIKYLNVAKLVEGLEAGKGTILELFAGRGYITEKIYASLSPRRIIAIDKDDYELRLYRRRVRKALKGKNTAIETYRMDNVEWIREVMPNIDLSDLILVDFDASGCPAKAMKAFFETYRVRGELRIRITDGAIYKLNMLVKGKPLKEEIDRLYCPEISEEVDWRNQWNLDKQEDLDVRFLKMLLKKYGYELKWLEVSRIERMGKKGVIFISAVIRGEEA
jgi:hypothetical protein